MLKEAIITLVDRLPNGSDESGNPVYKESHSEVYAVIKGVKRSEYYGALAAGLRPEVTFEIYEAEYGGEKIVEMMDDSGQKKRLNIVRTYPLKGERLEIICNDVAEAS